MQTALLGLALSGALTAGINLYATVLTLGVLHRSGWVALPGDLAVLADPWVLAAAGVLFVVEFVADKVPWVDSLWDAVHTFVRVPAGALLAWGAGAGLEPGQQAALALLGGTLALASHGTKLTLRAGVNASPEPVTNWTLSVLEDVLVVGGLALAAANPLAALAVIGAFVLVAAVFAALLWRGIRRVFARTRVRSAAPGPAA
ncbi:MAG TPA: DUF4126 domain-containing protein [Gemmatimonadota bacterium]|jgi:hypothetical protein